MVRTSRPVESNLEAALRARDQARAVLRARSDADRAEEAAARARAKESRGAPCTRCLQCIRRSPRPAELQVSSPEYRVLNAAEQALPKWRQRELQVEWERERDRERRASLPAGGRPPPDVVRSWAPAPKPKRQQTQAERRALVAEMRHKQLAYHAYESSTTSPNQRGVLADENYGVPMEGTLTFQRAQEAHEHVAEEMCLACEVIEKHGTPTEDGGTLSGLRTLKPGTCDALTHSDRIGATVVTARSLCRRSLLSHDLRRVCTHLGHGGWHAPSLQEARHRLLRRWPAVRRHICPWTTPSFSPLSPNISVLTHRRGDSLADSRRRGAHTAARLGGAGS